MRKALFAATIGMLGAFSPLHAAGLNCAPIPGIARLWVKPATRIILFGETHGTAQTPEAFGRAVCAALAAGKHVAVGLEHPKALQARYEAYLSSQGTAKDRDTLLAGWPWTGPVQDGRSSVAMFDLVERLRRLQAQGLPLTIFTFVPGPGSSGPAAYEAAMARNIQAVADGGRHLLVLALVGNIHAARSREIAPGYRLAYDTMAMHLGNAETLSVDVDFQRGGSDWTCRPAPGNPQKLACGAHNVAGRRGSMAGLTLYTRRNGAYDGLLILDRPSASPPEKP